VGETRRWIGLLLGALVMTACQASQPASALPQSASPPTSTPPRPPTETVEPTTTAYSEQRRQLVEQTIVARGVSDPVVIEAMLAVPRHEFVPPEYRDGAYQDHPLPIGYGQTISQPYIVALMTESLALESDDVVLEVGTGSGYQAAVLAEIVDQVYSIEIIGALAERATETLERLGYDGVEVMHADGYYGWEDHAPFDAIIVTAAPDHIPPPLVSQLADGARMVIPVGPVGGYQELWLVERHGDEVTTESLGGVRFVPLTRDVKES